MTDTLVAPRTDGKPYMTAREAADFLGLSENWLTEKARAGKVPHRKFGRFVRFQRDELLSWADGQKGDAS